MRRRRIAVVPLTLTIMLMTIFVCSLFYSFNQSEVFEEAEDIIKIPKIKYEDIIDDHGKYHYEDDKYLGLFGIDVSEFQEEIDWEKVKESGAEFAFIRLGRRGATTGLLYLDEHFKENHEKASKAGMEIGIYFFSQAINTEEAVEEAHFVIKELRHRKINLPVVYDCEEVYLEDETPRTDGLSKDVFTQNALAFCREIEKAGYEPMIYTYSYWSDTFYDMDKISRYPIWFAQYDVDAPVLQYPISIWQYTNKGKIDGIKGDVDFNIMFTKK